jgi:hypothetical protein
MIVIGSLVTSLILLILYREMGGPGDPLDYYEQAARLIPFTHSLYPGYILVIRLIRDLFRLDWFLVGKITSWLSACAFLALCYFLFKHLLGAETKWFALTLVAMNPTFIGESYSPLTIMLNAALLLAAIVLTIQLPVDQPFRWLFPGLVFGIAYLTRLQSLGLLIGAVLGIFVIPATRVSALLRCASALLVGAVFPVLLWHGLLLWEQGYIPQNLNYLNLAVGLGELQSWSDISKLEKYGSIWGVLTSHWSAPFRIAAFAAKEAIKFPFSVGYQLLFIAAGWLIPGLIIAAARRDVHAPWLTAFSVGLVLTGIGSLGWLHYYVVFVPFAAILIAYAIQGFSLSGLWVVGRMSWWVLLVSTAIWSPYKVWSGFLDRNWPEFTVAREHLEASRDSRTVVSTTAASFRYGTTMGFVDQDSIMRPGESKDLVNRLREHGVTHLIITERHTLFQFPDLKYLLEDSVTNVPAGLQRDMLIVSPRRLAIYRVLSP